MGELIGIISRLLIGLAGVYVPMFLWNLAYSLAAPHVRKIAQQASEEQKRSVTFLNLWMAGCLSAMMGIPNGIFIGLVP